MLATLTVLALACATLVAGPAGAGPTTAPVATTRGDAGSPFVAAPTADPGLRTTASSPPTSARGGLAVEDHPEFIRLPESCQTDNGYPLAGPCWVTPRRKGAPILFLWGDSHAWTMVPALREAVRGKRVNLVSYIMGGCVPMLALVKPGKNNGCDTYGQQAIAWIAAKIRQGRSVRVVYGASWELYHNAITPPDKADERYPGFVNDWVTANARTARWAQPRAFRALNRLRVPVDLVGQLPMVYTGAPRCRLGEFQCDLPRWSAIKDPRANNARIEQMRAILRSGGRVIRPARVLCTAKVCRGRLDGHGVYLDQLHIGNHASVRVAPLFAPTVAAAMRQGRPARRR